VEEASDIQRKILRILYAWGLEHFDKFMIKEELISRLGRGNIDKEVFDLKEKEMVEVAPDENWKAVRITPKGVQTLRLLDII